ncbi:MAG: DMT family transporter [Rhodospirillaceae bacterium]|nr:DMT family transporter [Rhodospirillaceae bacterium]
MLENISQIQGQTMSSPRQDVQSNPPSAAATRSRELAGYGFIAMTAIFFGTAPTFARLAFDGGSGALELQVIRFGVTVIASWTLVAILRMRLRYTATQFRRLALLSVFTGLSSYCYMTAVLYIPVPLATLIFFTFPIMVGLVMHVIGQERLTMRRSAAMLVAFLGLALVLGAGLADLEQRGVILAFVAGATVAASFVVSRPLSLELPALAMTSAVTTMAFSVYVGLVLATGSEQFPDQPIGWIGAIGNGVCYIVGLAGIYASISRLGAVRAAVVINLEPLVSVAAAWILLGQVLGPVQLCGALIVVIGVIMMQRREPKPEEAKPEEAKSP